MSTVAAHNGAQYEPVANGTNRVCQEEEEATQKTLGFFDSFALLTNNMTGPGMMGLPLLYHEAGFLPATVAIIFIGVCSGFCGTMLAETISLIPGNSKFERKIEYSSGFRMIIGGRWFFIAEMLLLSACFVQVLAGLVETAQSLDSFLASFLVDRTYALQLLPTPRIATWSARKCAALGAETRDEGGVGDCTPFYEDGSLVLSLGYVLMTVLLLPLGRGNLKETMAAQRFSFIALLVLLAVFYVEFVNQGAVINLAEYSVNSLLPTGEEPGKPPIPWWGKNLSTLGGVVLFNYAYAITLPSWLIEKKDNVGVNASVWPALLFSTFLYLTFGVLAASAFRYVPADILTILASKQSHFITQVSAAIFGVTIIGLGVPVFCVIIKNSLIAGRLCSHEWALFWGSVFPYLFAWMLYQGTYLIGLLNWTGLLVNGMSAFILPLVLTLEATYLRHECYSHVSDHHRQLLEQQRLQQSQQKVVELQARPLTLQRSALYCDDEHTVEPDVVALIKAEAMGHSDNDRAARLAADALETDYLLVAPSAQGAGTTTGYGSTASGHQVDAVEAMDCAILSQLHKQEYDNTVNALPRWLIPYRFQIVVFVQIAFGVIVVWSIITGWFQEED